jgi:hypothetical protein
MLTGLFGIAGACADAGSAPIPPSAAATTPATPTFSAERRDPPIPAFLIAMNILHCVVKFLLVRLAHLDIIDA